MGRIKYTDEFKREAIELVKAVGLRKASKELKLAYSTVYRWCHNMVNEIAEEDETSECIDLNAAVESFIEKRTAPSCEEGIMEEQSIENEDETSNVDDPVATAMAMLVLENMHLRESIRNLRGTLSGLTDHQLI